MGEGNSRDVQIAASRFPLLCFVCEKELERVMPSGVQPYGALMFSAGGNYGSRVFDPFATSEKLLALICDECVVERCDRLIAVREKRTKPTFDYRLVGSMREFKEVVEPDV